MRLIALLIICMSMSARAQEQKPVALANEPSHSLVFENSEARVWVVELRRMQTSEFHRHDHDYVFVTLNEQNLGSTGKNRLSDFPTQGKEMSEFDVWFVRGGFSHKWRNNGAFTARRLEVEVLKKRPELHTATDTLRQGYESIHIWGGDDLKTYEATERVEGLLISRRQILREESQQMRAGEYLLIPVGSVDLRVTSKSGNSDLSLNSGDVRWVKEAGPHTIVNRGRLEARFVTIRFTIQ